MTMLNLFTAIAILLLSISTAIAIISILLIVCLLLLRFWKANKNYIDQAKNEYSGGRYEAVVLTNKSRDDEGFIYLSGIMFLIKYLEKKKKPFKLMKKFDFDKFKEFIYDANCYGLYIIGHGARNMLVIGKGKKQEVINYSLFKGFNSTPKDFIVQLHCNNGSGESLADIIAPGRPSSYVSDSYRYNVDNLLYFICLHQPSPPISISLAIVILALTIMASTSKTLLNLWTFLRNFSRRIGNYKRISLSSG